MSVKIRLRRMGKKKQPHYRIVVTDTRAPRDGRFVENLGYYSPISNPAALSVDLGRVDYWVDQGAIVSPTVRSLVSRARAGGDDIVTLVGASADGDASAEVASANGAAAEAATGDAGAAEAPAAAEAVADADAAAEDGEADDPSPAAEAATHESSAAEADDAADAEAPAAAEAAADADSDAGAA